MLLAVIISAAYNFPSQSPALLFPEFPFSTFNPQSAIETIEVHPPPPTPLHPQHLSLPPPPLLNPFLQLSNLRSILFIISIQTPHIIRKQYTQNDAYFPFPRAFLGLIVILGLADYYSLWPTTAMWAGISMGSTAGKSFEIDVVKM